MQQLVTFVANNEVAMLKYVKVTLFNLVTKLMLLLTFAAEGIVKDTKCYSFLEVRDGIIDRLLLKDMKLLFLIVIGRLATSFILSEFLDVPREMLNVELLMS